MQVHNFAKAFYSGQNWDSQELIDNNSKNIALCQNRQQQMVISEDPIKYLEQFL